MAHFHRHDVEFNADGSLIRGWLYRPEGPKGPFPMVVMAGGFSCVKEMHLGKYAEVFTAAGLAVLLFDFRNLGASDGTPRQELNPWRQAEDYRHAITYATTLPDIDPARIRCHRPQLGVRQGAEKGQDAAGDPNAERDPHVAAGLHEDRAWHEEDPGADHGTDDDVDEI